MAIIDPEIQVTWSHSELSALYAGPFLSKKPLRADGELVPITGVAVDSRLVKPGDLFIALAGDPGERFKTSARSEADGHDYLAHALENGAAGAMVSQLQDVAVPQYLTEDTYDGLWQLGKAGRDRLAGPVLAVTGSSGKTTAKSFLAEALRAYAPPGSFNNHIGVPLSLANAWQQAPAWVFEIGTSNPGEIGPLTAMVRPDLAILLNVQNAHIENFSSRQALVEEKSHIFSTLPCDGLRVVHDELAIDGYQFGRDLDSHARIVDLQGDRLSLSLFGEPLVARVPGGGLHRALTLSACLLAMKLLDFELASGLALSGDSVPSGRGNSHIASGIEVVDDSYNANPSSMQAAITAFLSQAGTRSQSAESLPRRSFVVLGDMRELGDLGAAAHEKLLESLAHEPALHGIVLVGEQMNLAADRLESTALGQSLNQRICGRFQVANAELEALLVQTLRPGDRVLVKGSNRIFWASAFVSQLLAKLA
jgi:UDP-N-acetylmuramoyl-tripeptide--D-alanyl-D-alanine ligase